MEDLLAMRFARGEKFYFIFGRQTTVHCGSEPARESGVSARILSTESPYSRAGSLPHGRGSFTRCQGQACLAIRLVEVLRLHWQAHVLRLEPWIDAVQIIRARRVARLARAVLAHQRFSLAEIDNKTHRWHQRGVEVLAPGEGRGVQRGVIAAGHDRATHGL